jgi:hypothetical protein
LRERRRAFLNIAGRQPSATGRSSFIYIGRHRFLTHHVTTATGVSAPRLRHGVGDAWIELGSYRRRTVAAKRTFRASFDCQSSTSTEIEFDGDFALAEIIGLTRSRAEHADTDLLNLVSRAARSRYEEAGRGLFTDAKLTRL